MVLVADYQTAGRGQGTNSWESERGQNLTCSLGFSPEGVKASRQYILSMAIAVALTETLAGLPHPVSIKWPNDIYVGDKKICGILIENMLKGEHIRHCIIGIGLNVNQKRFVSDAPNPTSMALESGHDFDREEVLLDNLMTLETILDPESFVRVDRSTIVNSGKITQLNIRHPSCRFRSSDGVELELELSKVAVEHLKNYKQ